MYILGFETSAKAASICISQDGELVAQSFQHTQLTHSRTLMVMCEDLLKNSEIPLADIDVFAVAVGPGSFTGIRIGIATCKGLAWATDKPCIGVSTLEAMSWPLAHWEGKEICAVMDARRNQIYHARFRPRGNTLERCSPDRGISIDELAKEIKESKKEQILVGDGALMCYNELTQQGVSVSMAPSHLKMQGGWGVVRCGWHAIARNETITAEELVPMYHRMPQAERERLARLNEKETGSYER